MDDCGTTLETLADFHEKRLPDDERARLGSHLAAGCVRCRAALEWLADALPALRGGAEEFAVPSPTALRRAFRVFRDDQEERRRADADAKPSPLEAIARLVFGGPSTPAFAAGLRDGGGGGAGGEPVQSLYSTDGHDIDLWAEPEDDAGGTFYLIGQARSKESGAAVAAEAVSLAPQGTDIEPLFATPGSAEFHVPGVPAGVYTVRLVLTDGSGIVLPDVAVGT